jgi:nitrate reductase gamma subunit
LPAIWDVILLALLPYVAIGLAIVLSVYRYLTDGFSVSSFSSELLDRRQLSWGSIPWHYGIISILAVHIIAAALPSFWSALAANTLRLYVMEVTGWGVALFLAIGLAVLIARRIGSSRLHAVTSVTDWILLASLMIQVVLGLYISVTLRWGDIWYVQIVVPWLQSLVTFNPQILIVSSLPLVVKLHILNALILVMLIPFTRLIHMFTIPFGYLRRPYQLYVWRRPSLTAAEKVEPAAGAGSRRGFLRLLGLAAVAAITSLVGFNYYNSSKPRTAPSSGGGTSTTTATLAFPRTKVTNVASLVVGQSIVFDYPLTDEPNLLVKVGQKVEGGVGPDGDIVAFSRICQHMGCLIGFQAIGSAPPCNSSYVPQGPVGYCCCHNSIYDFANGGKVLSGPAPLPVPQVQLEVDSSNDIYAVGMGPPTIYGHNTGSSDVSADLQG